MAKRFTNYDSGGRPVAGRRPDVFGRQMALQIIKFADFWSPAGGRTFSHGEWLHKRFRGRLAANRRPDFFEWQKALQIILQTAKLLLLDPPNEAPNSEKNNGAAEGGSQGAAGLHSGAISGEKWGSRKGCKLAKPKKKRGSQSDQADFYNTKKEPRNVKVSPPTALAPAPARRPQRFRILLRRSAQAVGVQQRTVFKRRNALAIRCRARQVVVVRRARETHAGKINDLISAAVEENKKVDFSAGRARKRKELNVWFCKRCVFADVWSPTSDQTSSNVELFYT